jgi:hypothetical protein
MEGNEIWSNCSRAFQINLFNFADFDLPGASLNGLVTGAAGQAVVNEGQIVLLGNVEVLEGRAESKHTSPCWLPTPQPYTPSSQ